MRHAHGLNQTQSRLCDAHEGSAQEQKRRSPAAGEPSCAQLTNNGRHKGCNPLDHSAIKVADSASLAERSSAIGSFCKFEARIPGSGSSPPSRGRLRLPADVGLSSVDSDSVAPLPPVLLPSVLLPPVV
mmetsp:Transcript_24987/g.56972  ORF Transcript_24987/g.56972 Transcript_24987/m.56972 type:complete len:129 (-) Transcript_24987:1219-1605(-)